MCSTSRPRYRVSGPEPRTRTPCAPIMTPCGFTATPRSTTRCMSTPSLPTWLRRCATQDISISERSEEHTSELQSRLHLVCRLLLEKKKKNKNHNHAL